jgi:hypothetical protein
MKGSFDQQDRAVAVLPSFHAIHPSFQLRAAVCLASSIKPDARTVTAKNKTRKRDKKTIRLRKRMFSANVR